MWSGLGGGGEGVDVDCVVDCCEDPFSLTVI
jgi:hypothetical protein